MEDLLKTRVIFESFEFSLLSNTCANLTEVINKSQTSRSSGPFVFPKKKIYYCVLSSPHVYKNAREHFGLEKYRCLLDIHTTKNDTTLAESFLKVEIPPGVSVRINYLNQ
jgi:small subunit ribosomal protein S10